jgi:hypothetical protein
MQTFDELTSFVAVAALWHPMRWDSDRAAFS